MELPAFYAWLLLYASPVTTTYLPDGTEQRCYFEQEQWWLIESAPGAEYTTTPDNALIEAKDASVCKAAEASCHNAG